MSKKMYTEKDIYEGMVLECVESNTSFWTVGKQYIVDKRLRIQDDDLDVYWFVGAIVSLLNNDEFKVVEPDIVKDTYSNLELVEEEK